MLLWFFLAASQTAGAQPLFDNETVLEVELAGPLHTLIKNKRKEPREELPFTLSIDNASFDVNVRIRGNSRIRLCHFPPMRLNFSKSQTKGTVFAGQNKLKLVTHCNRSQYSTANVLEEYAAYRIFSLMADTAYRVRLLRIRYRDSDERAGVHDEPYYGFLIESKESLAARNDAVLATAKGVYLSRLHLEQAAGLFVFQYLIGNTDWSLATATGEDYCCHNVTLLDAGFQQVPVPYDFDMSGLVNARYAAPHPDLRRIKRVTQRLYRGYCIDTDSVRSALRSTVESRDEIEQVIRNLPEISTGEAERNISFLERFFKETENEDRMIEKFSDICLG